MPMSFLNTRQISDPLEEERLKGMCNAKMRVDDETVYITSDLNPALTLRLQTDTEELPSRLREEVDRWFSTPTGKEVIILVE